MRSAAQLNSGKNVPELSKSFDIAENIFARRSVSLENQSEYEETDKNFRATKYLSVTNNSWKWEAQKRCCQITRREGYFNKSVGRRSCDTLQQVRLRDVYNLIKSLSKTYKISHLCRILKVSRTSYYHYAKGNTYNADKKYHRARHEIRKGFLENMKRYGNRRIKAAIAEKGIELSRKTVAKLMKDRAWKPYSLSRIFQSIRFFVNFGERLLGMKKIVQYRILLCHNSSHWASSWTVKIFLKLDINSFSPKLTKNQFTPPEVAQFNPHFSTIPIQKLFFSTKILTIRSTISVAFFISSRIFFTNQKH